MQHQERAHPGDPQHGRRGIPNDAAGAAGVRGGDNRREITDTDTILEHMPRNGRADQRRGDIVEERGDGKHENEKHEASGPVVGQSGRHPIRHTARFEMAGKQRKANQKQKQIGDENPFIGEMGEQAGQPGSFDEAGPEQLLENDDAKPGERGGEGVPMKNGDGGKGRAKQQKIDKDGNIVRAKIGSCANGHARSPSYTPAARVNRASSAAVNHCETTFPFVQLGLRT